jgi:cytochrome c peroxidase
MDSLNWLAPIKNLFFFSFLILACKEPEKLHYQKSIPSPPHNPTSLEGIALGKKIFFLESETPFGKISCASCHKPDSGFSSARMQVINNMKRQVPNLYNLAYSNVFAWDGREKTLETVVLKPIANHEEMGLDLTELVRKMNHNQALKSEFKLVFGVDSVYTALVSRVLAQYVRSLIRTIPAPNESKGELLFQKNCSICHSGNFSTDFKIRKSVLAAFGSDSGKFRLSRKPSELFFFKTPGLANIKLTRPYMHNGSYHSLKEVVISYAKFLKIKDLKSENSKNELVSYLETL